MNIPVLPQKSPTFNALDSKITKGLTGPDAIKFVWPRPGQIRVRRLVHRGAPRPVSKLHSIKLGRIVQCESQLELEVATLLDAFPSVTHYAEQSVALHYLDETGPRFHVPDFMVGIGAFREFVEVKFEADIDESVKKRASCLARLLNQYGLNYRVVTESTIRSGHALSNAQKVLRRGRLRPSEDWSLMTYERIRRAKALTLGDFGWGRDAASRIAWLCHEILRGKVQVDWTLPLGAESLVYVDRNDMGGALPWA